MSCVGRGLVVIAAMLFVVPAAPARAEEHGSVYFHVWVLRALPGAPLGAGDRVRGGAHYRGRRFVSGSLVVDSRRRDPRDVQATQRWFSLDSVRALGRDTLAQIRVTGTDRSSGRRIGVTFTSAPTLALTERVVVRWDNGLPQRGRCGTESVGVAFGRVRLLGHPQHPLDAASSLVPFCASSLGDLARLPT